MKKIPSFANDIYGRESTYVTVRKAFRTVMIGISPLVNRLLLESEANCFSYRLARISHCNQSLRLS